MQEEQHEIQGSLDSKGSHDDVSQLSLFLSAGSLRRNSKECKDLVSRQPETLAAGPDEDMSVGREGGFIRTWNPSIHSIIFFRVNVNIYQI